MIFLMAAAAGGWFLLRGGAQTRVDVVSPTRGPAVQAVYATGTVEATVMLPIAARATARLDEINVDEGDIVKKGQMLARLEDEDLQKSLEELEAKSAFTEKDYTRKAALAKQGYTTKSDLDRARSDWEAARAAVARARAEAGYMKLEAPADGLVIRRDGEVGQMIPASQPVFWLSCCAPLRITTEVDEEDIASVKPGQDVLIRADAFPEQVFHGKVQSITPMGDPVARSYRVRVGFAGETPMQIGMTAETNIIVSSKENALLLPSGAVLPEGRVWLVREGVLVEQTVKTGVRGDTQTEILSGVTAEDAVVLRPKPDFAPGRKVRAVPALQESAPSAQPSQAR